MAELLVAGFIREVEYPTQLANVVLVKKTSKRWQMWVNYTNLNKAYLKDSFPLLHINRLVDNSSSYRFPFFIDAYLGYNQIPSFYEDEEKTMFMLT